ncbi:hypothetical protein AB0M87_09420 [Streptomyces sp. NPDC051320]|uniref:hypothetical protein n=1 Tax=Streptomyces sp. NPDC051320 TaxID=3154644 RepID=UPI00341C9ECE
MTVLKHYYRLVYWKRRLARGIPGGAAPARTRRRRIREAAWRLRPLMVFAVIVLMVVGVSYGIGSWETGSSPQPSGHADPQAVCEQRVENDCPGAAAQDTCRKLLAQAHRTDTGTNGQQGQALSFVRCRPAD